jgi:hypothetical protein
LLRVTALAFSDEVLDGQLPPQIEVESGSARATEFAHAPGTPMYFRCIAEQRLTVPVVVTTHRPLPVSGLNPKQYPALGCWAHALCDMAVLTLRRRRERGMWKTLVERPHLAEDQIEGNGIPGPDSMRKTRESTAADQID